MYGNGAVWNLVPTKSQYYYFLNPSSRFQRSLKWNKPDPTWLKLNVDGSCKPQENAGAIGGVIRTDTGAWVCGFTAPIRQPTVNETELQSMLRGLELAWERRIHKLQVETDSEIIFGWLSGTDDPPHNLLPTVDRCKVLLRMPWEIDLKKIDRRANECADHLASLGYTYGREKLWLDPPISAIPILGRDNGY